MYKDATSLPMHRPRCTGCSYAIISQTCGVEGAFSQTAASGITNKSRLFNILDNMKRLGDSLFLAAQHILVQPCKRCIASGRVVLQKAVSIIADTDGRSLGMSMGRNHFRAAISSANVQRCIGLPQVLG